MEPTTPSSSRPTQRQFAFGTQEERERADEVNARVSSDPNVYPVEPLKDFPGNVPQGREDGSPSPIWLQRVWLVIYVVFCVELGILLSVLPWTEVWNSNALLAGYPNLRMFLQNNFVRGLVTGMGLVDIWLGIWEAVQYRGRAKD